MVTYNRRQFLKAGGAALGLAALGGLPLACSQKQSAQWEGFRYSMCNESLRDRSWAEQCDVIGRNGYTGVEIASFTLVEKGVQEISPSQRQQMVRDASNAGIEVVGLHWLLSPPPEGLHFTTPDKAVRQRSIGYLDQLIDFCGDLGGKVMVFGSPNQRSTTGGATVEEANQYFADGLAQVADHARQRDVKILLESLSKDQTDVVNTLAEAMEIVNEIDHPAIQTMFDFHNTADETEPLDVLVKKYFDHIYHVHVQEMDGTYLGTGDAVHNYVKSFQTLKNLGYDGWVSLEVFDFSPGGETIASESMKTLKQIEAQVV